MDEPGGYEDAMYEDEMEVMREMRAMEEAEQMAAQQFEQYENEASSATSEQPPAAAAPVDSPSVASTSSATHTAAIASTSSQSSHPTGAHSFFQNSPALSQISAIADDTVSSTTTTSNNAVQRRLFGTPFASKHAATASSAISGRIASTPFVSTTAANRFQPIDEDPTDAVATRKRRLEDLFGDIADIGDDNDDPHQDRDRLYNEMAKRSRTEAQIDLEMIEQILERRKRRLAATNTLTGGDAATLQVDRLEALHRFKQQNLAYALPRWPYTTLRRGAGADRERVYVRMHSEEFERTQIEEVGRSAGQFGGLLGSAREETWTKAQQIINDRLTATSNAASILSQTTAAAADASTAADVIGSTCASPLQSGAELWVEKYRPKKYVDLLSDETTNRSLLSWLKMWDKVVFNRDNNAATNKPTTANSNSMPSTTSSSSSSSFAPRNRSGAASAESANSFNKKTGKFEPFGRFRGSAAKRAGHELRTERDELGRPQQKVVLLCGPPGLGKTTLAHTIARHAGYTVRELNASDDRSPEAFRQALENGTQMQPLLMSFVGDGDKNKRTAAAEAARRPNCIVLDEIDGAPGPAIEYLCRFITDGGSNADKTSTTTAVPPPQSASVAGKRRAGSSGILRRPVICICNDMYAPALRPLRQLAFIVNFSAINAGRLAERLAQIARRERMHADMTALLALAEKTGNDVRACLAVLQFHHGIGRPLTLLDVLSSNIGQKDRQRGLFAVWSAVFQIRRPCKTLVEDDDNVQDGRMVVAMTDMSTKTRAKNILDTVQMGGDYERLMYGVHENYLTQKMPDPNMRGVADACDWFCFSDRLRRHINHTQNYTVYGYQQFPFVAWHFLFGSLVWPKISFPSRGQEFVRKATIQRQIETALRRGFSSAACGIGSGAAVLLDTVPLLRHVLCPQLRSVSLQLLSPKERSDLRHTVDVMVDLGLIYVQTKSADGTYQYQMEPNINMLGAFDVLGNNVQLVVSYAGRQIIAREVELEKMRRVVPKETMPGSAASATGKSSATTTVATKTIPNHLRTLPKPIISSSRLKETVTKDFFGRLSSKQMAVTVSEGGTDVIVKSPIWYRYKEGCNNAVRKDVTIASLL